MVNQNKAKLLHAMRDYGGSFASKLAEAWMVADSQNDIKLSREFGDLSQNYRKFIEPRLSIVDD